MSNQISEVLKDLSERRSAIDRALRDGSVSSKVLTENYAYVYKAEENKIGMGRSGSADLTESGDDYILFTVSTLEEDRDGDIVVPMGCKLHNFVKNPVWFFGHQQWEIPIGISKSPDGVLHCYPEQQRVRERFYPDKADEDAMFIFGKVQRGILNATSIAFVPISARRREDVRKGHQHEGGAGGWIFDEWDKTETSIVGVPSNAAATVEQRSLQGALRDALDREKQFIRPRLQKALQAYCAKSTNESGGCWTGWCPTCPPVQKETPVIAKESPDEFGELAWRRANKTDKPEVRTMSQANMLKLSRESDRFTIGDIEAGSINGTVTISRYSGGFMLTKKSLAKPPVQKMTRQQTINLRAGQKLSWNGQEVTLYSLLATPGENHLVYLEVKLPNGKIEQVNLDEVQLKSLAAPSVEKAIPIPAGAKVRVLQGEYTGTYTQNSGGHWVSDKSPGGMPLPNSTIERWVQQGKAELVKSLAKGCGCSAACACKSVAKSDNTLVHWFGTPTGICTRKDSKDDERTEGGMTFLGTATHIQNVTCPLCKKYYKDRKRQGKSAAKLHQGGDNKTLVVAALRSGPHTVEQLMSKTALEDWELEFALDNLVRMGRVVEAEGVYRIKAMQTKSLGRPVQKNDDREQWVIDEINKLKAQGMSLEAIARKLKAAIESLGSAANAQGVQEVLSRYKFLRRRKGLGESSGAAGGYAVPEQKAGDGEETDGFLKLKKSTIRDEWVISNAHGVVRGKYKTYEEAKREYDRMTAARREDSKSAHRCTFCKGSGSGCGRRGDCPDCDGRGVVRAKRLVCKAQVRAGQLKPGDVTIDGLGNRNVVVSVERNGNKVTVNYEGRNPYVGTINDLFRNVEQKSTKQRRRTVKSKRYTRKDFEEVAAVEQPPHEMALAQMYQTARSALNGMTPFDPQTGEENKLHKAMTEHCEALKSMWSEHGAKGEDGEPQDLDEMLKGMETSGPGNSETGEANLTDNGIIPEEVEAELGDEVEIEFGDDEETTEEKSVRKASYEADPDYRKLVDLYKARRSGRPFDDKETRRLATELAEAYGVDNPGSVMSTAIRAAGLANKSMDDDSAIEMDEADDVEKSNDDDQDLDQLEKDFDEIVEAEGDDDDDFIETKSDFDEEFAEDDMVQKADAPVASTKIKRDGDEFIVEAYDADGKRMPNSDYYTDDRADAQATARAMVNPRKSEDDSVEKSEFDDELVEGEESPSEVIDDPDVDEILERYDTNKGWRTRKAGRARVRKVLAAGGRIKRGQDGRKWLVLPAVKKGLVRGKWYILQPGIPAFGPYDSREAAIASGYGKRPGSRVALNAVGGWKNEEIVTPKKSLAKSAPPKLLSKARPGETISDFAARHGVDNIGGKWFVLDEHRQKVSTPCDTLDQATKLIASAKQVVKSAATDPVVKSLFADLAKERQLLDLVKNRCGINGN